MTSHKLTVSQIDEMYKLFKTGQFSLKQLGERFNVNATAVSYQITKKLKK
ncbi:hypothetical protein GCM10011418_39010 [Sphingobacterium alkalisoli]|nr:hypothetical protein GCM10011418_39010 [Sphingobacterium alkalisoli]